MRQDENPASADDLERFVHAQEFAYADALAEVRAGAKESHWMWFVFPQLRGLGRSAMAEFYGLDGADEARAFLGHPVLGPRLREIMAAAAEQAAAGRSATEVFGVPDDLKLRSCATLFAGVGEDVGVFESVLEGFFGGERCAGTLGMLAGAG